LSSLVPADWAPGQLVRAIRPAPPISPAMTVPVLMPMPISLAGSPSVRASAFSLPGRDLLGEGREPPDVGEQDGDLELSLERQGRRRGLDQLGDLGGQEGGERPGEQGPLVQPGQVAAADADVQAQGEGHAGAGQARDDLVGPQGAGGHGRADHLQIAVAPDQASRPGHSDSRGAAV
jgi:hypothetical protein